MSAARSGASVRSAGVRRLLQEAKELERDDCADYAAAPLEDDIFSWHFTVRGPKSSDFQGGVYHGRLVLPSEYPFKPPEVYMLTPSGRFEVNKKICLSISSFHPETWQPSWGIRTALVALMAFFESEAQGAVGSLDAAPMERQRMARASRTHQCPTCGFDAAKPDSFAALADARTSESPSAPETGEAPVSIAISAAEEKEETAQPTVEVEATPASAPRARKPRPASIETTIFPSSTASVRTPSSARHAAEPPQSPPSLNPQHHHHPTAHPFASPGSSTAYRHRLSAATAATPAFHPPGAPRLSPAHLPARNPFGMASPAAEAPNPLRASADAPSSATSAPAGAADVASTSTGSAGPSRAESSASVNGGDSTHLHRLSDSQQRSPPAAAPAGPEEQGHDPVQLPALPPGVGLAQVSSGPGGGVGGVGGPPSWVDRAIVACVLAIVALVVRKVA